MFVETTDAPDALTQVMEPIDNRLHEVTSEVRSQWIKVDPELGEPFDALAELVLIGGKRLRPAFFHWAHVGAGGVPFDPLAVDAGAAIEMLHAFALAHDDIMDASSSRRGHPTVHVRFAEIHRRNQWHGDPERWGEAVAILVGDLAHVLADHLMHTTNPEIAAIWSELRLEVNVGQYLDVLASAKGEVGEEAARRIVEYKTGRYSVQRPLHLGAALAGRIDDLRADLTAYGQPVGIAFQLRDDILGAFGDSEVTGKPVGDDLREGKPTPLLATARRLATPAQTALLSQAGDTDMSEADLADLQQAMLDTGAVDVIESEISDLTNEAMTVLGRVELAENAGEALGDLATFVAYRSH
ncbi:MAG: polyprenyl synthetase family protein [Acidimicrobiales bacterium]